MSININNLQIVNIVPKRLGIVLLIKPINFNSISLDKLKSDSGFDNILIEPTSILLNKNNSSVVIQPNRIEFNIPFYSDIKTITDTVQKLLSCLQELLCTAIGINYFLDIIVPNCSNAGIFIKDNFLKNVDKIEQCFEKPIIGNSTRIFMGTPEYHYDIRLFPLDKLNSPNLGCQFHVHSENENGIDVIDNLNKRIENDFIDFKDRITKLFTK